MSCGTYGGEEKHIKVLVGTHEGKRPSGRFMLRWEDNIKTDLKEVVWEGVDWIDLVQGRDKWWTR